MLTRDIDIAILSVRPSVCPSVLRAPVLYQKGFTYYYRSLLSSANGSPIILVFPLLNIFAKFRRSHPPRGALNTGRLYKFRDFRPISDHMWKTIHSYYGTVIGSHMRFIEPWHFRWPWVTFEGHFRVLLFWYIFSFSQSSAAARFRCSRK